MIGGRVFDVPALVHLATGHTIYPRALLTAAERTGTLIIAIPVPALAAARGRLAPAGRAELDKLDHLSPVIFDEFTTSVGNRVGDLLAQNRSTGAGVDVVAGAVALSARRRGWPVVTNRGPTLLALDAALDIEPLP